MMSERSWLMSALKAKVSSAGVVAEIGVVVGGVSIAVDISW